jgi:1,4-dihydroxy-2-naphthoate octaprenyltransferase
VKIKYWIKAARLRTLPLAFSCILLSSSLVIINHIELSFKVLFLTLTTTLLLQILSNFANDYGDAIKGLDENRTGEQRMVQSGKISKFYMNWAIVIISIITLIVGIYLIFSVFKKDIFKILFFLLLGICSIIAAIKYTVGKSAYGYKAYGDLSVFIFFGIVGVIGSYYLFTKNFHWITVPGALFTGLMSCGVLNLNNMRDYENDKKNNKVTLVVKMGINKSKKYHFLLLFIAISSLITIVLFTNNYYYIFSIFPLVFVVRHLKLLNKYQDMKLLDSQLKVIAISCFGCSFISLIVGLLIN